MNHQAARTIATLLTSAALLCAQSVRRPPTAPYQAPDAREILGPGPADLGPLLERYASDLQSLRRFYDVQLSPTTDRVMRQFYEAWRAALQTVQFDSLPQEGRIDYLLFRNKLDHEIRQLDLNRKRSQEIAELTPFAPAIIELKEARQRVDPLDPSAAATTLEQISKQMEDLSKRINEPAKGGAHRGPEDHSLPSRAHSGPAARHAESLVRILRWLRPAIHLVGDPAIQKDGGRAWRSTPS